MDIIRTDDQPKINWITQPETQQLTHQWRAEEDAILVGHQTVVNDNPSLTVRAVAGNNPKRIILTSSRDVLPVDAKVFNDDAPTIVLNNKSMELKEILKELYSSDIQSLIVEGGKKTLEMFLDQGIWDEARILTGSSMLNDGLKAPEVSGNAVAHFSFGKDTVTIIENA